MSKFAHKRGVGGHIKEGLKAVKETYKGLYNSPSQGAKTGASNLKAIATGRTASGQAVPGATRAKVAAMGVASVTPVGPIAAFAAGVKKSVAEAKKDRRMNEKVQAIKQELREGTAPPPTGSKSTFVKAARSPETSRAASGLAIGKKTPPPPAPTKPKVTVPSVRAKASDVSKAPPTPPRRPAPVRGGALPPAPPKPKGT